MKRLIIFIFLSIFLLISCENVSVSRKNDSNTVPDNDEQSQTDSDEITSDTDLSNDENQIDESQNDNSQTDDFADNDFETYDDDFLTDNIQDEDSQIIPDEEIFTDNDTNLPDNDEFIPDDVTPDDVVTPDDITPDDVVIPDDDTAGQIEITVGTYNLENFFDTECDSGTDGSGNCNDMELFSIADYNSKLSSVAASIRSIGSDIQIIVEIEDYTAGNALLSQLSDIYDEVYIAVKYDGSQNVGVLTKGTITNVINHGTETDFAREFPEIHISYLGKSIIVFPVHFKSKSNDDPERRLREATKAAEIINEVAADNPDSLIVMGGDLNDEPGSDPLNALDSADLLRTASDLSTNEQCTYNYNGCESIDHIYLSLAGSGNYISKSAKVIKDGKCGNGSYCLGSSDHAAIKADFKF